MTNPTVAERIYMMPELRHRYQRLFIHQLNNLYIGNIWIYLAMSTKIFVQILSFLGDMEENKSGCFLLKHRVPNSELAEHFSRFTNGNE